MKREETDGAGHPLRADARSNRLRILEVAEEVFGKGGRSASTEEVARLAGVGIATVFRHFPTKGALLEAVLVRHLIRLRDRADDLSGSADPGAAFFGFFAHVVDNASEKLAIIEAFTYAGGDPGGKAALASDGLREAIGVLLRRAQDAGAVRNDIGLPELYVLLVGSSRAVAHTPLDREVRDRALAVVFDGLAPGAGAGTDRRTGRPAR
ncbi:AcrR family transcriptional regulator [Streptosporangium album]|uniref:AcrR family transcriptional regulator n=1 Tax=Streptosporangium album TaxID=47479 RepID=A0A7W7RU34_9ACTN|nr:TetR/AcrR family transcriptional regulator [Streptosporangium album]MBB4937942.1 AcrR family transcriptional regulator [Streptosporangium album]